MCQSRFLITSQIDRNTTHTVWRGYSETRAIKVLLIICLNTPVSPGLATVMKVRITALEARPVFHCRSTLHFSLQQLWAERKHTPDWFKSLNSSKFRLSQHQISTLSLQLHGSVVILVVIRSSATQLTPLLNSSFLWGYRFFDFQYHLSCHYSPKEASRSSAKDPN